MPEEIRAISATTTKLLGSHATQKKFVTVKTSFWPLLQAKCQSSVSNQKSLTNQGSHKRIIVVRCRHRLPDRVPAWCGLIVANPDCTKRTYASKCCTCTCTFAPSQRSSLGTRSPGFASFLAHHRPRRGRTLIVQVRLLTAPFSQSNDRVRWAPTLFRAFTDVTAQSPNSRKTINSERHPLRLHLAC